MCLILKNILFSQYVRFRTLVRNRTSKTDTFPRKTVKTPYIRAAKRSAPTATISSKCVILKYFLYYNIFVYLHYISKHHIYYV